MENSTLDSPPLTAQQKTCIWLEQLKVGDEVIYIEQSRQSIKKVARTTAKQFFLIVGDYKEYEVAFWKKDGSRVGGSGSYSSVFITMPDPATVDVIRAKQEMSELRKWLTDQRFTLGELRAMKSAVDDIRAPKDTEVAAALTPS